MKVDHEENKKKGSFFIIDGNERLAELLYFHPAPGMINIYHTEVDPKLRGTGAGGDLVAAAVKYARDNDLKIIATCPFAKKVIDRSPEYRDLLADEQ